MTLNTDSLEVHKNKLHQIQAKSFSASAVKLDCVRESVCENIKPTKQT
jgi:hypothetical protein